MDKTYYIDKIKFLLTGNILESELNDEDYERILQYSLQELNRYYNTPQLVQVNPSSTCIDLAAVEEDNNIKISSIAQVYRVKPTGISNTDKSGISDPMLMQQWNLANNMYALGTTRWFYNYLTYNTLGQISNTLSTDLDFKQDMIGKKLYVNFTGGQSVPIVIEYIPVLEDPDQIKTPYWVDILSRLMLAHTKINLGRIRTRYTQDNALWKQDGETMLNEGNKELEDLRARLQENSDYVFPLD